MKDGQLPAETLGAMTSLTLLRISRSDCTAIPEGLAASVTLKVLILAFNNRLRFGEDAITVFMNMPQLETLKLQMDKKKGLQCGSVASIVKLSKRLPTLELIIEDAMDKPHYGFNETSKDVWSRMPDS